MSLLKEAQKRWQLTESFSKSLYALLNATPKHKWNGLRVADEEGAITVRRFERTKNGLKGRVWSLKSGVKVGAEEEDGAEEALVDEVRALAGKWKIVQ